MAASVKKWFYGSNSSDTDLQRGAKLIYKMARSSEKVAIGIDLGTTNSCVAAVRNGRVEIIANDMGSRLTPSCVAFTDEERLIGDAAKAQAVRNYKNTVFQVKRIIGRKFDDKSVQNGIKNWPFTVVNHQGNPNIEVEYKNERKTYAPKEISAAVLSKMKGTAETYLGCPVKDAVITVPAYFNDSQRQATIDAGKIAKLNVMAILNEPTAAAVAYGVDKNIHQKRNILVYDLGGGTFDAAIVTVEKGKYDVHSVTGNTYLGGEDFDNLLVKYFADQFQRKHKINLNGDRKACSKLRKECERAKCTLSSDNVFKTTIGVDSLFEGIDFTSSLTRGELEEICSDLFSETIELVKDVLKNSNLNKSEIHEVVLAGGSTRIPKIPELLKELFSENKIKRNLHPDESIAYGAALHAAVLSRDSSVEEILLKNVTPLSLSVNNPDGTVTTVVPRNTKIPTTKIANRTTVSDYQTSVTFGIYEGERKMTQDNHLLGKFNLQNIESALKGVPSFELIYNIDSNGILHVTARDWKTGSTNDITITTNKGRLQKEEIERMAEEAKQFQEDEREQRDRNKAQSALAACAITSWY